MMCLFFLGEKGLPKTKAESEKELKLHRQTYTLRVAWVVAVA
jgi:hypothetical protein